MVGAGSNDRAAYVAERQDHLGIVAGICREIGLAAWLDAQDEGSHERVRVRISMVAMILNDLGFSNRRLYLVPQFFATKPVERLLGPGMTAADLSDDCLGRALDWLDAHDPTSLFAGIAQRARQVFGVSVRRVHMDTTSFSVSGDYTAEERDLDALLTGVCSRGDVLFHVGKAERRISPPGRRLCGGVAGRSTD